MQILFPIRLLGLIPWALLAAWLLRGRHDPRTVPFLPLWRGPEAGSRRRHSAAIPPWPILLLLASIPPAIFGTAGLQFLQGSKSGSVTFLVDRGITMSARGAGDLRYREAGDAACEALSRRFGRAEVRFVAVPDDSTRRAALSDVPALLRNLAPTAIDTRPLLADAVRKQLREFDGPLILISDGAGSTEDRVIRIAPTTAIRDTGITRIAAAENPAPQVMATIRNDSAQTHAALTIHSAGDTTVRRIDLLPRGEERNAFVDPPSIGATLSAELDLSDDQSADKRAWLAREGGGAQIEPRCPLPASLARLVAVYSRSRPPSAGSERMVIVNAANEVPDRSPAVILAPTEVSAASSVASAVDHPVTRRVNWSAIPGPVRIAASAPSGWEPLVRMDVRTVVAVRSRQVWIGFDAPQWAATTDYVIFWTDVLQWAGGGGSILTSHPLSEWSPEWKPIEAGSLAGLLPGLYRRSDGALRAFNAPDVPVPKPILDDWRARIAKLPVARRSIDLSGPLLIVALICVLAAALTWSGNRVRAAGD